MWREKKRFFGAHLVCFIIHAIFSVVHWLAEMMRSPSFSRVSSSITTKNSPAAKAASASDMASNANAVRCGAPMTSVGRHRGGKVDGWACLREVWDMGAGDKAIGAIVSFVRVWMEDTPESKLRLYI